MTSLLERLPESDRALLARVAAIADHMGVTIYLVGGAVRDLLQPKVQSPKSKVQSSPPGSANPETRDPRPETRDYDVLVDGDGIALAEAVGAEIGGTVVPYPRFHTATVVLFAGGTLDFASARTETYPHPGALPVAVRSGLREDLYRRDFTVNAMAVALNGPVPGHLLDPFGGRRDLAKGVLRALHERSFIDDPTRVLRAARFEVRLGARMEPTTGAWARETVAAGLLDRVSGERLRAELLRLATHPTRLQGMRRLEDLGVPTALEPTWTITALPPLERRYAAALRWAARQPALIGHLLDESYQWLLFITLGLDTEAAGRLARRLRLPNVVAGAMRRTAEARVRLPALDTPRGTLGALERLLGATPDTVCLLLLAQLTRPAARARLRRYLVARHTLPSLLTGRDLAVLGVPDGPAYRLILDEIRARQLAGSLRSRRCALALARELNEENEAIIIYDAPRIRSSLDPIP